MFKNQPGQYVFIQCFNASANQPALGSAAALTPYRTIGGGTATVLAAPTATEVSTTGAPGLYRFAVGATDSNGDSISFTAYSSTSMVYCLPRLIETQPLYFPDLVLTSGQTIPSASAILTGTAIVSAMDSGSRLQYFPSITAGVSGGLPTVDGSNAVLIRNGSGVNSLLISGGAVMLRTAQTFDMVGNISGNISGSITYCASAKTTDISTGALGLFFTVPGVTYASATAGSVGKEIADNAGGAVLTVTAIVAGMDASSTQLFTIASAVAIIQSAQAIATAQLAVATAGIASIQTTQAVVTAGISVSTAALANIQTSQALVTAGITVATAGIAAIQSGVTAMQSSVTAMQSDVTDVKAKTNSITFTVAGKVDSNVLAINGETESAIRIAKSTRAIAYGTCDAGCTTTSIVTSALSAAAAVADQFKGKIVTFDYNTTTAALRNQSTDITASTDTGILTVTALTSAPAAGDVFCIT